MRHPSRVLLLSLACTTALAAQAGDVLAILSAGAYCMTMASNYNTRQRPAEILVDGDSAQVIRTRDTLASLWADERLL